VGKDGGTMKWQEKEFVAHPDNESQVRVRRDGFGQWIVEVTLYSGAKTRKRAKRKAKRLAKIIRRTRR
jgi:hypothetical protein